jgi:hypothetical protein
MDARLAVQLTTTVAAAGVSLTALEDLVCVRQFADTGLMSWQITKLEDRWLTVGSHSALIDFVLRFEHFRYVLLARFAAAVLVLGSAVFGITISTVLLAVLLTSVALMVRSPYGHDGAQHMNIIVFAALFASSVMPWNTVVVAACLWFIGLQAATSYMIAGISKLTSSEWRTGRAIVGILGTSIYGHRVAYRLLRDRPFAALVMSWLVIFFECGFVGAMIFGVKYRLAFLALGVLFHAGTAVLMGLNGFFLAWIATYPALMYVAAELRHI